MSEQENRDTLERYHQEYLKRQNIHAVDDLMRDDYVEEYPQSGERIRSKDSARTMYESYPGLRWPPHERLRDSRIRGRQDQEG